MIKKTKIATVVAGLGLLALAGCTASQLSTAAQTPVGQLFCGIATASGPLTVAMIDAAASGPAAPVAVVAAGATSAWVNAVCAAAGGVPVSPPSGSVPTMAVVVPPAGTGA